MDAPLPTALPAAPDDGTGRPVLAPPATGEGPTGAAERAAALIAEAQACEASGRREEARAAYHAALGHLPRDGEGAAQAAALLRWIGRTYQVDAEFDTALDCLTASLAVAELTGDAAAIGHAVNLRAIVHFQQGELDEAERLWQQAREQAVRAGDAKLAAMTAQNLGNIANVRGDTARALAHYEASLLTYRELGLVRDVVVGLNNLGRLHTDLGRVDEAERAYTEGIDLAVGAEDASTRLVLEANLADLLVVRGEIDRAAAACERVRALAQLTNDTRVDGETAKARGLIARARGRWAEAERHLDESERVAVERRDLFLQAHVAREKAELFRLTGRNRELLECLNRAYRLFAQLRARRSMADVDWRTAALEGDFLEIVRRWGTSIESADHYTQGHCERVADVACALAARVGFDDRSLFWFRVGALLHDVGKTTIPPEILNKPGRLTEEDWVLVRRHPTAGVELLAGIDFPWDVRPIVESHHERWDGRGYPHGLVGEAIPLTARILAIADVYDALTSERSYKRALSHDDAMTLMRDDVGGQFDPALFAHFEALMAAPLSALRTAPATGANGIDGASGGNVAGAGARAGARTGADAPPMDELTGVLLRKGCQRHGEALIADAVSAGTPVSLLVIDVDHFKLVNDTYGHLTGDAVLRHVAHLLDDSLRPDDVVGRWAGDEFVVLLPRTPHDVALEVGERLRAAVHRTPCLRPGTADGTVSASLSIGVATTPEHGTDFAALFDAADVALYAAKRQGRNAVSGPKGAGAPALAPLLTTRYVGRDGERQRLVLALESACAGRPRLVTLVGEAGIGKSRLIAELVPEVRLRGGALVGGRCLEADVRPPYGPWSQILAAIHQLGIAPTRTWRELPRLVGALGQPARPVDGAAEAAGDKYVLLDEVADFIRAAAAVRPLTLVLDDLQWADAASWDTLEYLLAQLTDDRVLLCVALRVEDMPRAAAERRRRLTRDERVIELQLGRLPRLAVQEWIASAFNAPTDAALVDFLYERSEGNPLFVQQVLRAVVEEGCLREAEGAWVWRPEPSLALPATVGDLIARRIERLAPASRRLLTIAASIGREFDADLLLAAAECDEETLLDALDRALEAAIIEPVPQRHDRFTFTHALLVDALRAAENPRRVALLHRKIARVIETLQPTALADIATHAALGGERRTAHVHAMEAGQRALAVYAYDDATRLLALALQQAEGGAERAAAHRRLARAAELAGHHTEAEHQCALALEALGPGAPDLEVLPLERRREAARALTGRSPHDTLAACGHLLERATAAGLHAERIALLAAISQAHRRLGEEAAAEAAARECAALADLTDDPTLIAEAHSRLGITLVERTPREAEALFRRVLGLFEQLGDLRGQARAHVNIGVARARCGNETGSEAALTRAAALGRDARAHDIAALAAMNLGVIQMKRGEYETAGERMAGAHRFYTGVNHEPLRLAAAYNLAHLAREAGRDEAARRHYREVAGLARRLGQADVAIGAWAGLGLVARRAGDGVESASAHHTAMVELGGRHEWWFQGREVLEALLILRRADEGGLAEAVERLGQSCRTAQAHDPYSAAWLLAECAPALAARKSAEAERLIAEWAPRVRALGYAPLVARLEAVHGAGWSHQATVSG